MSERVEWDGSPVARFAELYQPEDYTPEAYIMAALPVLRELSWLWHVNPERFAVVQAVLDNMYGDGLDEDNYPFGLLWGMVAVRSVRNVPALERQLVQWREWCEWCETDQGYDLSYLPELP